MNPHVISTAILVTHWLIVLGLTIRIVLRRPPAGFSLAWLAVAFSVPFAGAALYLLLGEKRLGWHRAENMGVCLPAFRRWQQEFKIGYGLNIPEIEPQAYPLICHA